ncbi:MAG: hypothetical protein ACJ8E3_05940 [Sphingomicrobium sp.]
MHSVHQSRARIFFEVLCALGMSASLVGAWLQTYAPAFLPGAAIAALYGIVHAFDMIRGKPAPVAAAPSKAPPEPVEADDSVIRSWPLPASVIDEPKPAERGPASVIDTPKPVESAPAKAPAKKRRTAKAARAAPEPEVARLVPEPVDVTPEVDHPPIAPLFEPEPFVRQQQRAAFGRKAG